MSEARPGRWALEAVGVVVHFGGIVALAGVDLRVAPGEVVALVGPNGAGKSTLLDCCAGVVVPDAGSVLVAGGPPASTRGGGAAVVARTHQQVRLVEDIGVDENIALGGHGGPPGRGFGRRRVATRAAIDAARTAVGVDAVPGDRLAGRLSGGEARRVELARLLLARAAVVLLDEPLAGVAEADRADLADVIRGVAATGAAVVLVEHHLEAVRSAADRVVALDAGVVVDEAPASAPGR